MSELGHHDPNIKREVLSDLIVDFSAQCQWRPEACSRIQDAVHSISNQDVTYVVEPWVASNGDIVANELLFSYRDQEAKRRRFGNIVEGIECAKLKTEFDLLNLFNVLSWMQESPSHTPLSMNINPETLADPAACEMILEAFKRCDMPNITLEILEGNNLLPLKTTKNIMRLNEEGIRFVLDDFRISLKNDWDVLGQLQDIVHGVKLDGPGSVRPYLNDGISGLNALAKQVQHIRSYAGSNLSIIAEWVQTRDEALSLYDKKVTAVQGQDLIMHV